MKKIIIAIVLGWYCTVVTAQVEMAIEGAVQVGNGNNVAPVAGTIRWNGADLEGYNGYEWISLTSGKTADITDVDGNTYQTVRIGELVWMAENLRTSKYSDGTAIPRVTGDAEWDALTTGAFCWFDNDAATEIPHGKLYNWYAVETEELCPVGWRMPSETDFLNMFEYLGGQDGAGAKLKSTDQDYWVFSTGNTNETGFNGVANAGRLVDGAFSDYFYYSAKFWSSSEDDASEAWYMSLSSQSHNAFFNHVGKQFGFSVRCVKIQ